MHAIVILPMALACLSAYADDPGAAEKPVADWTLNPAERSARLHRIKRELFTEVSQSIGFSSRLVYGFDQDEQGFIWIGTGNGLDRFDGYTVRSYKHDPGSTDGLSSNSIRTLAVGTNGIVWAGTHATGLDRFDASTCWIPKPIIATGGRNEWPKERKCTAQAKFGGFVKKLGGIVIPGNPG
jgi:hypothetical protein